jgi:starch synthase
MKVLLAASEVVGFAKTGGLADVAGSLPPALERRGHTCAVILPLHRSARTGTIPVGPTGHTLTVPVGSRTVSGRLWRSTLPGSTVAVYLVEQPDYFGRDDPSQGRGLYQYQTPEGPRRDYADNCERFVFFCRAVLDALHVLDFWPDVIHLNDWQTGLVPVYLQEVYRRHADPERHRGYERLRSLFTIHNIAYQGLFWHWDMHLTGLDWRLFNYHQLEYHGSLSFLKAGIVFSDQITTVSPTYAQEILTPDFGSGLQGALAERKDRLFGIVNGVDYSAWDPATDPYLEANYDSSCVVQKKPLCKRALQEYFGLPRQPRTPLLAMIARLAEQKGVELVVKAAPAFLEQDTQLVVLGVGDPVYHQMLQELRGRYPDRVGLRLVHDEPLSHQVEAGADLFLMPSRFEPCGLNQMYSLKYGTVPVVRATGGLADTIVDCTPATLAADRATGFVFLPFTADALLGAVRRALEMYRLHPEHWLRLMHAGMRQDWSWDRSAAEYERLYEKLKAIPMTG